MVMISGVLDRLVPPYVANDFARTRSTAAIALVDIQGAGHFDLVMPGKPAFATVLQTIHHALGIAAPGG